MSDATIKALQEALSATPENQPLRRLLAETLLGAGQFSEAIEVCRQGLSRAPDLALEMLLAESFRRAGRNSESLVVLEALCRRPEAPATAHLSRARLLTADDVQAARAAYRRALELDEALVDPELAARLGVSGEKWRDADERVPAGDAPRNAVPRMMERPQTAFADVGGMESVKDQIQKKIIYPLRNPEIYKAYGKKIGGGILMYGPPGCGKTHLARATAGEVHAGFIAVGISDVLNMWIGESERNLRALFDQARENAPCVLFFDEVDALGASRTDMRQSAGRQLINQFLSELDGIDGNNDGILVLAATNAPWHLDPAFRRPGRFDRIILVPPPDELAREAILRIHLRGKPAGEVDYAALARKTKDFSGADLTACIDGAIEELLEESMSRGVPQPLNTKNLLHAIKRHRPTTKEWFATARNYALFSNQGGHYDEILEYLKLK
ncbi:MAG: AAA family ATPase [Planctomycetes bacterium]|nr:AAA family ATPase [Planctomycetota bacterium]MCW8136167.1 AAA family ATPase [Planctomycetota bacterium]